MNQSPPTFFESVQNSKKILVLDLGFLGDTIHLIPSLRCIRKAMPDSRLEVVVASHIKSIMDLVPWVDQVHGYPRFPTSKGFFWHIPFIKKLRAAHYNAVINLNGSDRSSFLTRFSGAPLRLGRTPPKVSWYWRSCFTHVTGCQYDCPVYLQRLTCLHRAGFPDNGCGFDACVPEAVQTKLDGLLDGEKDFIHISPFTTQDSKELPISELAKLIDGIHEKFPDRKIAVSVAPNDRERVKLQELLAALKGPQPWRVFDGHLNLVELGGLIGRAALHLGGDSGALHVALMMDRPTVSWWRDYEGRVEWQPVGKAHRAVIGAERPDGLKNIRANQLLKEMEALL